MDSQPTGHVFISYDREDQPYTRKLAEDLRQRGFEVWMDDRIDFGDRWWKTIVQAIRASAAFVVVMTPDSEESEWVEREILLAQHEGKPVFPLLLRGHGIPLLVTTQYANVTGGRLPPDEFYERLEREVRAQTEEEVVAPVAPEPTVRKEHVWGWQQLRLPLAVVGLLALVILVGVAASGLFGIGGKVGSTPQMFVPPTEAPAVVRVTPQPASPMPTATPKPATATVISQAPTPTPALGIGSILLREKDGMEMVYVPGGTFEMGSTDAEIDAAFEQCEQDFGSAACPPERDWFANESRRHSVALDSFWMDRTEVTNAQYAHCVADGTCTPPSESGSATRDSYYGDSQFDNYPVIYLDWEDADTYCQWAGGRLPTEAEWEYAARGPEGNVYPWGNDPPDDTLLNHNYNVGDTTSVGSYGRGESWVGTMDMAGNVWEWVSDWYAEDYYSVSPAENPTGPYAGDYRVQRGGAWDYPPLNVRSAYRGWRNPDYRDYQFGFRCVVASSSLPTPAAASTPTATSAPPTDTPGPRTNTPVPASSIPPSDASLHDAWTHPVDGMEMVYVPGGTFQMGSTEGHPSQQPVHAVTLDSFWIDRTEVTNGQYALCVAAGVCSPPYPSSSATRDSYYGDSQFDDYPVINVTWNDADTYCGWAGGRLPAEAEWEYAARGPDGHIYPWGDDAPNETLLNYYQNEGDTTEVGSYPDGASWVGALDMGGNVWEWVDDWYDGYPGTTYEDNHFGTTWKVLRGGSWVHFEEDVRAANRSITLPDSRNVAYGFRCVVEPGN